MTIEIAPIQPRHEPLPAASVALFLFGVIAPTCAEPAMSTACCIGVAYAMQRATRTVCFSSASSLRHGSHACLRFGARLPFTCAEPAMSTACCIRRRLRMQLDANRLV